MRIIELLFLAACLALCPTSSCRAAVDWTSKLQLKPGLTIKFPIRQGIDTRRKPLGDYIFNVTVVQAGKGFKYEWTMDGAASATGTRAVTAADEHSAVGISLFYDQKRDGTMLGNTSIVRVSDAVYQALKAGSSTPIKLDGPDPGFSATGRASDLALPSSLTAAGEEQVYVRINNKRVLVNAIKAQADNGWTYWILDNADFPVMVAGAGPFYWQEPEFVLAPADNTSNNTNDEASKVAKDLQDKGIATTRSILFAFDSDKISGTSAPVLQAVADFLRGAPSVRLEIQGHTDNVGSFDYNMKLSVRRAEAVKRYLVDVCKIDSARLLPRGFGYTEPVSSNTNETGRALNRRVVFKRI